MTKKRATMTMKQANCRHGMYYAPVLTSDDGHVYGQCIYCQLLMCLDRRAKVVARDGARTPRS